MILQLELVKELIRSQNCVVKWEPGETHCPICRHIGFPPGKVLVSCTCGEIRYCSCETCGGTFRAVGEEAKKKPAKAKAVKSTRKKVTKAVKSPAKADKKVKLEDNKDNKVKKKRTRKKKEKVNGNEK